MCEDSVTWHAHLHGDRSGRACGLRRRLLEGISFRVYVVESWSDHPTRLEMGLRILEQAGILSGGRRAVPLATRPRRRH
jgi:hypothetical protein